MKKTLKEEHITPYWRTLFTKICPQNSISEWEGVDFIQVAKAAMDGDKSAKEYIFWQMKDIIETKFSKDRKRISIWANHLNISEKNSDYSANDVVDNWVSASWMAIFDGYPVTNTNTIGPFIKYVKPGRELDYLTWVYYTKVGAILYMSNNLEATGGMSTELTRNLGNIKQDLATSSSNEKIGSSDHSIDREIQDDFISDMANPEEEFELQDNLKTFRAFTRDPELTKKKNGFSPMIAFKTVITNMAKGENAEKNVASLAAKYNVSRNTFASYAQRAANDLVKVYNLTLNNLQNLIKRYGPEALSRLIKESSYNPKPLNILKENYNFKLLESIFNDKAILNESDESIYDAHAQYEKDVEQKKEEDDNQENFKFDEGFVKLTTVKEGAKKSWNNFFDKLIESRDTYTSNAAEHPCCDHTAHQDQYEDCTCEKCGEIWEDDDLDWHPKGDEYEDGYDNHKIFDSLEESTNLKEGVNPHKAKAHDLCEKLTADIDWEDDDECLDHAADRILGFIYALIGESMDFFPTDAYDHKLWGVFDEKGAKYEN